MTQPFLNVTLPVYNEERVLAASVGKLAEFLKRSCPYSYAIVIANNGSTDQTHKIAEELSHVFSVVRVEYLAEAGRGRAIKQVWSESPAVILSYMDVDLSTDLSAFPPLIESVISGGFDLATGSRLLKGSVTRRGFNRKFLSWSYHLLLKALLHTRISDAQCGFKAITKEAACRLLPLVQDNGWLMDTELLIIAERLGYRILDLPVRWIEDPDSRVKIGRDSVAAIKGLLRLCRNLPARRSKANVSFEESSV